LCGGVLGLINNEFGKMGGSVIFGGRVVKKKMDGISGTKKYKSDN